MNWHKEGEWGEKTHSQSCWIVLALVMCSLSNANSSASPISLPPISAANRSASYSNRRVTALTVSEKTESSGDMIICDSKKLTMIGGLDAVGDGKWNDSKRGELCRKKWRRERVKRR